MWPRSTRPAYDQPLLQAMYVDKRLDGVQAVQTLSRLNRIAPDKGNPFVLDFVNNPEDIAAKPSPPTTTRTQLEAQSEPNQLDGLKHELDEMQVYHQDEVERFAKVYFLPSRQAPRQEPRAARQRTATRSLAGSSNSTRTAR